LRLDGHWSWWQLVLSMPSLENRVLLLTVNLPVISWLLLLSGVEWVLSNRHQMASLHSRPDTK
jgi:hypothetical protein